MSLFSVPFVGTGVDSGLHVAAFFIMIVTVIGSLYIFWKLHEMPLEKARKSNKYHQYELITILTWIGFFIHWAWVVAVVIAFFDFDKFMHRVTLHKNIHLQNGEADKC